MRSCLLVSLLLTLPAVASADEPSEFYVIQGFSNPALKAGHYLLSVTPHFRSYPYETNTAAAGAAGPSVFSSQSAINNHFDYAYDLTVNSLYGVSDGVTFALSLAYTPKQSTPDGSFQTTSQNTSPGFFSTQTMDRIVTKRNERLHAGLALSYRPRNNVELSLNARYAHLKASTGLAGGGTNETTGGVAFQVASNSTGDHKESAYDIWLSFVVLGR